MMRRPVLAALMAMVVSLPTLADAPGPVVSISGAVLQPGTYQLQPDARLRDASATARVSSRAWSLGAALLRERAIEPQQRLKSGLLFELNANRVHAMAENNLDMHALADHLYATVAAMPVTGRVVAELNPLQQVILRNNALLENGDRILYPRRPEQVRVMGAVERFCSLPHAPAAQPIEYLRQCPPHRLADPSFVYVIQPNGSWARVGLAAWNREPANVAVGAVLYVPLGSRFLAPETTGLNDDFAALLATQYRLGGLFDE
jgi:hypothetical protein